MPWCTRIIHCECANKIRLQTYFAASLSFSMRQEAQAGYELPLLGIAGTVLSDKRFSAGANEQEKGLLDVNGLA